MRRKTENRDARWSFWNDNRVGGQIQPKYSYSTYHSGVN
jgi:hypothetical protein